jgi:hypothetical protein
MEPILGLLAVGSAIAAAMGGALVSDRRELARMWLKAAKSVGLGQLRARSHVGWPVGVDGRKGRLEVRACSFYHWEARRTSSRVEVRGVTSRMALQSMSAAGRAARDRRVLTGDAAFDAAIVVNGDDAVAAALLDARTRDAIRESFAERIVAEGSKGPIAERGVWLDPGCLVSERVLGDNAEWTATYLDSLLQLAERLQEPDDLPTRLMAGVKDDPVAGVRLGCLRTILREPDPEAKREALGVAIADRSEEVRLQAALEMGSAGRPVLLAVAAGELDDLRSARAIGALRSALPAHEARAILERALRGRRHLTAIACVESLSYRGPEHADVIGWVLATERGALAVAAARALGRAGSRPALVLLREAEERLAGDGALKQAVDEAVAAIRGRLVGAGEGQVSLAGDEPGRVSLAADEAGRVSLPSAADERE